jgi:hypothetical protein
MNWHRKCGSQACVEVAVVDGDLIAVRNSTRPETLVLFTAEEWSIFTGGVKDGTFDHTIKEMKGNGEG